MARIDKATFTSIRGYANFFIGSFRCGVFVPPNYDEHRTYPLVTFLHGFTALDDYELEFYKEPFLSKDPAIVLTPKSPSPQPNGWGHSWKFRKTKDMKMAFRMIDLAIKAFPIDKDRIYIYGSSMGGFGTFAALRYRPKLFAAAAVECGGGNPSEAGKLKKIPLWMRHGEIDDKVNVDFSRRMYNAIKKAGGNTVRYTEYKSKGHEIWELAPYENTIAWLMAQRKGKAGNTPDVSLNAGYTVNEDSVAMHWDVDYHPPVSSDNDIWYVRIERNGKVVAEVNSKQSSFRDTVPQGKGRYEYSLTPVNYYFKEGRPETFSMEKPE